LPVRRTKYFGRRGPKKANQPRAALGFTGGAKKRHFFKGIFYFSCGKSKPFISFPMKIRDFSGTGSKFPTRFQKLFTDFILYTVEKEEFINYNNFTYPLLI